MPHGHLPVAGECPCGLGGGDGDGAGVDGVGVDGVGPDGGGDGEMARVRFSTVALLGGVPDLDFDEVT